MYNLFKKFISTLQLLIVLNSPTFSFQIINLDFSGLESISKLGKSLNKLPKYDIKTHDNSSKNPIFKSMKDKKLTLSKARKSCDNLSINGKSVWYLPTTKDILVLSTDTPCKLDDNITVYIKKEYLKLLPTVKNAQELTYWTSDLEIEDGYKLGNIISFAYSFSELQNSPLDLSSDKKERHYIVCKKANGVINIKWKQDKFISIYKNNFRLPSNLALVGSFDLKDKNSTTINLENPKIHFPLKRFLLVAEDKKIYILDLKKEQYVTKMELSNKIIHLKDIKEKIKSQKKRGF